MDFLTLFGLVVAVAAVALGTSMEGGQLSMLVNFPALCIVLGGTIGAVMVQTPMSIFKRAIQILPWVFKPPQLHLLAAVHKIVKWSKISRRDGFLGLENVLVSENYFITKKALSLLVDGAEPETIRQTIEVEIDTQEQKLMAATRVFESMGGYCPTIGILGAVLGLIQVMQNLSDPSQLGIGIAVAFVATVYGVGLANLLFLPVARKLQELVHLQSHYNEMLLEGIVAISEGDNPRMIEMKLKAFIVQSVR